MNRTQKKNIKTYIRRGAADNHRQNCDGIYANGNTMVLCNGISEIIIPGNKIPHDIPLAEHTEPVADDLITVPEKYVYHRISIPALTEHVHKLKEVLEIPKNDWLYKTKYTGSYTDFRELLYLEGLGINAELILDCALCLSDNTMIDVWVLTGRNSILIEPHDSKGSQGKALIKGVQNLSKDDLRSVKENTEKVFRWLIY